MMSFGGTTVDAGRPTDRFPAASLLTGLLGNALGYHHNDTGLLQRLQDRLVHGAARLAHAPKQREVMQLTDYQTVDLGQDHLVDAGWTTDHRREDRAGGFSKGTHIRTRDYLVDADYLVALRLEPSNEEPTLDHLAAALDHPARPLFIGRKACPPATRLHAGFANADSLKQALLSFDLGRLRPVELWLPVTDGTVDGHTSWASDRRDWANQAHTGRRLIRHEHLAPAGDHA